MAQIRWTLQAAEDFESIAVFISKDSPHYAQLFVRAIFGSIDHIAQFPNSGKILPEFSNHKVRQLITGNYRIVYRSYEETITILAIYHTARILNPSRIF